MAHGSGWMHGLVKAVLSGDCVVVMGNAAQGGPPPEKTITLASLVAPRMARRDGKDEPHAFASREFMRKLLIGKQVKFRVEYAVASIGREFGQVYVGDDNASLESVANGWAKVRQGGGDQASNHEELVAAEAGAQAAGIGLWTKDPTEIALSVRHPPTSFDPNSLLPAMKGRPMPCIVEAVLNGAALRVQLMTDGADTRHATCTVFLAGVQAPAMKTKSQSQSQNQAAANGDAAAASSSIDEPKPEPFAREAKHFTEVRLLNRDVLIVPEGTDKYNNLFCTIRAPDGGDVAELLTQNGLVKVVDWSLAMMTAGAATLRAAEKAAKLARRCMWRSYVAPPPNPNSLIGKNFLGTVVEVASGDSIVIADSDTGAERRVTMSSIRAPKMGNERRGIKPEPWAHEAKEFLRTRCVGKRVKVSMEYQRKIPTQGDGPEIVLDMGTVLLPTDQLKGEDTNNGVTELNVAEMLVLRGLASIVRHRNDDEDRSLRYDDLMQAEQRAIKGKKGVQNKDKPAPVHHVNDISQNANKSKQFLPFLQRAGTSHAIVDYVLSGHRLKLSVPKEGALISFAIAGVRCPQRDEPGAAEALRFVRHRCAQRDCEIDVEGVDKTGTFLGTMTYSSPSSGGRQTQTSLGLELLRHGLATLHGSYDPNRHANGADLVTAQDAAKHKRLGVWVDWSPEKEAAEKAAAEAAASSATAGGNGQETAGGTQTVAEICSLGVTEVVDASRFFCQRAGGDRAAWVHSQLQALAPNSSRVGFEPRKGAMVAGRFTGDDEWYRAIVVSVAKDRGIDDSVRVHYCDFGNGESLPRDRLAPLDPTLASTPPLAHLCALSHVKIPGPTKDHHRDANNLFGALVSVGAMDARIDRRGRVPDAPWDPDAQPEWRVTLGVDPDAGADDGAGDDADDGSVQSVNAKMVAAGLARLERWVRKDPAAKVLVNAETRARRDRVGMWEYGDVDSDDEEEERPKAPGAWGRRR